MGNRFLSFIALKFEHEFTVVKFEDEEDGNEDPELSKQLKNCDGEWFIVNYTDLKCEFCETHSCNKSQYR